MYDASQDVAHASARSTPAYCSLHLLTFVHSQHASRNFLTASVTSNKTKKEVGALHGIQEGCWDGWLKEEIALPNPEMVAAARTNLVDLTSMVKLQIATDRCAVCVRGDPGSDC